jgi:hypothetical protein
LGTIHFLLFSFPFLLPAISNGGHFNEANLEENALPFIVRIHEANSMGIYAQSQLVGRQCRARELVNLEEAEKIVKFNNFGRFKKSSDYKLIISI